MADTHVDLSVSWWNVCLRQHLGILVINIYVSVFVMGRKWCSISRCFTL